MPIFAGSAPLEIFGGPEGKNVLGLCTIPKLTTKSASVADVEHLQLSGYIR